MLSTAVFLPAFLVCEPSCKAFVSVCVTFKAATLFFSDTISALAVVSFDVFNEMFVVLAEIFVVFLVTFEVLAAIAFLSELMCRRLSAMSLVFVEILVVFVDCCVASFVSSVVLFVTLFSIFLSVVDDELPPLIAAMDVLIVAISFVFVVMLELLAATDVVFRWMFDAFDVMLFVFELCCVRSVLMLDVLLAIFVAFVAILTLLAAELPPDDNVRILALLVAMSFLFVVALTLFVFI